MTLPSDFRLRERLAALGVTSDFRDSCLPCVDCGKSGEDLHVEYGVFDGLWSVYCGCGPLVFGSTPGEAVTAWNRANPLEVAQ